MWLCSVLVVLLMHYVTCAVCFSSGILKPWRSICAIQVSMGGDILETEFTGAGTVMVASPYEFGHTMSEACVFLYDCTTEKAQGVILQSPTAFTLGEMAAGIAPFDANPLFTGGDAGDDTAIMIGQYDLGGYSKAVGTSGLYVGGLREAKALVREGQEGDTFNGVHPLDFKFFYKSCEWTIDQLDQELANGLWKVCVPALPQRA